MFLRLYNTISRKKEVLKPLNSNQLRFYVCGPTVYDLIHIGNARPIVVFDLLFRVLQLCFGDRDIIYVRNITDVDDKINKRAREENISIKALTDRTIVQFHKDVAALGVLPPTKEPRVTEHIPEIIVLIDKLLHKNHAYVAEGHVLFDVEKMEDYGTLANRTPEEMQAGSRVEIAPYKRNAVDFVLWKPSSKEEPGWESPWGWGRPGWHIECSAMAATYLGESFDIHGGGIDLIFPHHENESAQSRCAYGTPFMARIWMHNGFLRVEGQKMSKSLGNYLYLRDIVKRWKGEVVRLALLMTHYRQPIDFTERSLHEAQAILEGWQQCCAERETEELQGGFSKIILPESVQEALYDDLNTPRMIAALHVLRTQALRGDGRAREALGTSLEFLGLSPSTKNLQKMTPLKGRDSEIEREKRKNLAERGLSLEEVERLIQERNQARQSRDFAKSDHIRTLLGERGILLRDQKNKETGRAETVWMFRTSSLD